MAVTDWSTTPADNDGSPPTGAPEGMAPSTVNDVLRQIMADVRVFYDDYVVDSAALAALPVIASGTYTPTISNSSNVAASTPAVFQYLRIGSVVTVSGSVNIDPTSAGSSTIFEMSLPIASALASANQVAGSVTHDLGNAGPVLANTVSDTAQARFVSTGTAAADVWVHFTYLIV